MTLRKKPRRRKQPQGLLFFVAENPTYRGCWWTAGGYFLWATYAPDEVDRCFYIPQETFWHFLALAQKIPEWCVGDEHPVFWKEAGKLLKE